MTPYAPPSAHTRPPETRAPAPTYEHEHKLGELREIGHDGDGGALYTDETGDIWNAGDDHECGAL